MPAQRGPDKDGNLTKTGIKVPEKPKTHRPRCYECDRELPSDNPRLAVLEGWNMEMGGRGRWYWLCPEHSLDD